VAELDDITKLGALDEAIRAEERASERATQRLADENAGVAQAAAHTDDLAGKQRAARDEERSLESRLDRYTRQLAAALRSLETGVGNPEVSERQRVSTLELIDEVETGILECIENQEHLTELHAAAVEEHAALAQHCDAAAKEVMTELAERAGRLAALREDRVPALAALAPDLRRRYDALRAKKGAAVTTVDSQNCCTKCRMLAPTQQLSEVRRGRLEQCRGCGRWLTS
jgi:predicted  nucleic acid-binding Zn-ribbon protein